MCKDFMIKNAKILLLSKVVIETTSIFIIFVNLKILNLPNKISSGQWP